MSTVVMARQKYVAFNFDKFSEQGLAKVVREFEKNDTPIISGDDGGHSITATNKIKRIQGMPTKSAQFHFEDGQSVTLIINNEGSVFQVKLNSKIIPVTKVSSLPGAVREISAKIKQNSKTFSQALARKAARAHAKPATDGSTKKVGNSIPARLKAVKAEMEAVRGELADVQVQAQDQQESVTQASGKITQLKKKIQGELSRKESLLDQLETLKAQAA